MKTINEGNISLEVDEGEPWDKEVFYNSKMVFDRNLSVAVASVAEPKSLCDPLSASGVRGIRYAKETDISDIWLNDASELAFDSIKKNCDRNDVECIIKNEDAGIIMRQRKFDFIDIDPFGSPSEFFDSASHSIKDEGYIGLTATDTAAIFGTYPRVSRRRYGRNSMLTDYNKELGMRIIISALIESLGRYKKTFYPKLCYFEEHYTRIFGQVKKGATKVQDNFRNFNFISHCFHCGWRLEGLNQKCKNCGSNTEYVEVYCGKLNDNDFCSRVIEECSRRGFEKERDMVEALSDDVEIPYHYDLHYLAKKESTVVPNREKMIAELRKNSYKAKQSVYLPTAIKTDAPYNLILKLIVELT